jgi:hypothetical protein
MKIGAGQTRDVTVQFTNDNGHPAHVQGTVSWSSSDSAVAKVVANTTNPSQATITAGPKAGKAQISAHADADLGEGVTEVTATLDVEVIARGEATGGEIVPVGAGQGLPGQGGTGPDNTLPGGSGGRPDQGLPGSGARPDQDLPGHERPTDPGYDKPSGGHPDQDLPGRNPRPDQGLPGSGHADQDLPGSGGRPSQGLPGDQPGIDNSLPGGKPSTPDQDLPDHAKPKR